MIGEMQRRFLYAVDEDGNEIAGSRRDISHLDGNWRAVMQAEGELRRMIGEDCEVVDALASSRD